VNYNLVNNFKGIDHNLLCVTVFMCERRLFMEQMCVNKEHGRKLYVTSSCSGVHGRISMNKPLDSYFK
jgi:hypothetical protein